MNDGGYGLQNLPQGVLYCSSVTIAVVIGSLFSSFIQKVQLPMTLLQVMALYPTRITERRFTYRSFSYKRTGYLLWKINWLILLKLSTYITI